MTCNSQHLRCQNNDTSPLYCLTVPSFESFDCGLLENCWCPRPQANPDIAGIGVVTAFLSSALLAWFTTVGYILLEPRNKSKRTNPIDELWKKHICLPVQRWVGPHADVWSECFYRVTFSLSDQQLVTGIAILTAGFKMLAQGTITAYHFSIVRDLAFFSSNAHLLSLLVLWTSFGSIRKHHKRTGARRRFPVTFVTMWRFSCMAVFFGLLMAATWMSAHRDWDEWADCPARCIPKGIQNVGGVPIAWAIATTYFMVTQYSSCAMQLGEKIMGRATGLRKRTRDVDKGLRARLKSRPILLKAYKVLRLVLVSWRFYNWSEFFELLEMMVWFLANCYWVAGNRAAAKWVFDTSADGRNERAKEDEWGFGQIVPLFLLMLPAMTFVSTYHEAMKEKMHTSKEEEAPDYHEMFSMQDWHEMNS